MDKTLKFSCLTALIIAFCTGYAFNVSLDQEILDAHNAAKVYYFNTVG